MLSQRDPADNVAILSGDLNGDDGPDFANNGENSYHVVTGGGTNVTARLDGFTIRNGNGDGVAPDNEGGAILIVNSSPTINGCEFLNNSAVEAGALFVRGSPLISNSRFVGNALRKSRRRVQAVGNGSQPRLQSCIFSENGTLQSVNGGGAIFNFGNAAISGRRMQL